MANLEKTIARIRPLDEVAMAAARARQDELTKPRGSLGRLEELAIQVAGIQGRARPSVRNKAVIVMAGDHAVCSEGVSAYPAEVTPQMVYNFLRGGAAINSLAGQAGARVLVVDIGVAAELRPHPGLWQRKVAPGAANIARGPAMTREQAIRALEVGIEAVEAELGRGLDMVATGDMGIGNTTPSSAIVAAVTGLEPALVTGRGTGLDDAGLRRKVEVVERALRVNRPDPRDGLDVLAKVGGYEIAGLAGVILGAAANNVVVLVDGFISGAAAVVASLLCPVAKQRMIQAHLSVEIGHQAAMRWLGAAPLLDLGMRLGEGTGAALGMMVVEAAVRALNEMATFAEAGVAEAKEATPAAAG
ncbi:MAG: nicotinate-nucleotide--dimethylbenzimidazole phosphoribosyltransferase [Chloroflexi bacterium]|nr:nicotinate-nucleotide--dimethylbenzimidazole phosphoribosyltransferase [Chloroflexota bacterium]MCL5109103.1 nicotinate-nucleotide--dimethylbenzimidazole phosphoribosyltransferase [Chloroflexota bacterium]